jgi:uncharacterized protein DUF6292
MANDADPYIKAVADACRAAGLFVAEWWTDDIDPRDGGIDLVTTADADPEDWGKSRTLGWNEERGWLIGQPKGPHGDLTNILYLGGSALPDPAGIAEQARRVIAGEVSRDEQFAMMRPKRWRDQEDEDGFEEKLAVYREEAALAASGTETTDA